MSYTNQTTHYGLPQWIGSDKPTYLVDQNNAYQTIDSELYNANTTAGSAQTAAEGAVSTAGTAASTAASAVETAQAAQTTASGADSKADSAISQAQAAQTAAGAAQAAAAAAQEAAAGNSITNLAPAYDPTITYAVDDLVTAEGKLYKCIVAVVTPEQFDINKWDDVTTSEVFVQTKNKVTKYMFAKNYSQTSYGNIILEAFNKMKQTLGNQEAIPLYIELPMLYADISYTVNSNNTFFSGSYRKFTDTLNREYYFETNGISAVTLFKNDNSTITELTNDLVDGLLVFTFAAIPESETIN